MINDESSEAQGRAVKDEKERERPPSAFLGLGSNLGDREANLCEAVERIKRLGLEIAGISSIYETEPVGYADQPWFLNQAIEVRANPRLNSGKHLDVASQFWAYDLLCALQKIEREMGRERTIPNGPRVIDIDVLICGDAAASIGETQSDRADPAIRVGDTLFLTLPHPRMHERRFVLEPLCEIAPDLVHPVFNKTCRELLAALDDHSTVKLYKSSCR